VVFEKGSAISGRVVFDEDDAAAAAKGRTLRVVGYSATRSADWSPAPPAASTVAADGAFRIDALKPGTYELNVGWGGDAPTGRFYVWSTEVDGAVTNEPIAVTTGEDVDGVVLHMRYGEERVSGVVHVSGALPAGVQLFVAVRREDGVTIAYSSPLDEHRRFIVENVPVGLYDLLVTGYVSGTDVQYASKPVQVAIRHGATPDVEIAFDPDKDVNEREARP